MGHSLLEGAIDILMFLTILLCEGGIKIDILLVEHDLLVPVEDIGALENDGIRRIE